MQFDLFRISMAQRQQIDMAEHRLPDGQIPSREQWLRIVFARKIEFTNRGQEYYFTPIAPPVGTNAIAGRIGRQTAEVENQPPDEGFEPIERDSWHASDIFMDPVHHEDGQQLAMEVKGSVGTTHAILAGLATYLNDKDFRSPYFIEIGPISDPESFWEFVHANEGNITTLTLEAPVPNMFGHKNDFDEDMRKYRDDEKARKVAITLRNPDGLEVNTETVRDAVDYTSKTGGNIKAKAKKKRSYNSKKKTKTINSEEINSDKYSENNGIFEIIRKSFGRLLPK